MNIPCMTLRDNTERPETIEIGTNELLGVNPKAIAPAMEKLLEDNGRKVKFTMWDGKTANRIVKHLLNFKLN